MTTIKSINMLKRFFSFQNIFILTISALLLLVIYKNGLKYNETLLPEGFEGMDTNKFELKKSVKDIYDPFYSNIYDDLCGDEGKHYFEIEHIGLNTNLNESSKILDIGSACGHTVNSLSKKAPHVIGLDKSKSMCDKASEKYPKNKFIVGDASSSITFDEEEFTHITCLYFTVYYFQDKRVFFKNCYDWLKPGGHMIVHIVNKEMFDPVLPKGNPLVGVNAQKYTKERILKTDIVFKNFNYTSHFVPDDKKNGNLNTEFVETFSTRKNKKVFRKNIHRLYMEDQSIILSTAKQMGFIVKTKYDMRPCTYEYNYLYVLKKPN